MPKVAVIGLKKSNISLTKIICNSINLNLENYDFKTIAN